MTTQDKLALLIKRCKASVQLTVNDHRDNYETAEKVLARMAENESQWYTTIPEAIRLEMVAKNTIINLHFYPDSPVGFYTIYHHDLDAILTEALECVNIKVGS